MKVYTVAGTALTFNQDQGGNSFASFDGTPSNQPKRVSASTELTSKGIRRVMLKVEIPFVSEVSADGTQAVGYKIVSAHVVLNIPAIAGIQLSEAASAQTNAGAATAVAQAMSCLSTILTGKSTCMTAAEAKALTAVVCRGSNGFYPVDATANYGSVS